MIIYFHEMHFENDSRDPQEQPPWIAYWICDNLKERMKQEKENEEHPNLLHRPKPSLDRTLITQKSPKSPSPTSVPKPPSTPNLRRPSVHRNLRRASVNPQPPSSFVAATLPGSVGTPRFVGGASVRQPFGALCRRMFLLPSRFVPPLQGCCHLLNRRALAVAVRCRGGCHPHQPLEFNGTATQPPSFRYFRLCLRFSNACSSLLRCSMTVT
ncbi:hypothetical protein PIB30_099217, partial [Stylosanthes scabra]|nr:hypothetical protein [Stylosanthes scabra]